MNSSPIFLSVVRLIDNKDDRDQLSNKKTSTNANADTNINTNITTNTKNSRTSYTGV